MTRRTLIDECSESQTVLDLMGGYFLVIVDVGFSVGVLIHLAMYQRLIELLLKCVIINTRQVTRATHVRNRVCPRVELILKIINILLIIFLVFIKRKPCESQQ